MLEAFPYVPIAERVRVGIAIFSYDGGITFGVTGDYDTAPDIDVLCRGIEDGMAALLDAAGRRPEPPVVSSARARSRAGSAHAPHTAG